jgi:hypothetical protein
MMRAMHKDEKRMPLRARAFACALLASTATAMPAVAQPYPSSLVPPRRVTDARGMDLVSGQFYVNVPMVSFGEHATGLRVWIEQAPGGFATQPSTFMNFAGPSMAWAIRPQAYSTGIDGSPDEWGAYENIVLPNGAGFVQQLLQYPRWNPDQASWSIHTNPDGSRYGHSLGTTHVTRFQSSDPNLVGVYNANGDRAFDSAQPLYGSLFDRFILANGEEWRFYRQSGRLRFLTSSRGYGIQILYMSDSSPGSANWNAPRQITGYNKAFVYCNESLLQECAAVSALPSATIAYDPVAATITMRQPGDADGIELNLAAGTVRNTAVANSAVAVQYAVDNAGSGYATRITDSDGQWNYTRITYVDDSGHIPAMSATSTNPDGSTVSIFGYGIFGTVQYYSDELNRLYLYSDGFPFRDNGRTEPEGDDTMIGRDERNNITSIVRTPKPNTGLPPITVYTASYPVHCTNPRTCNKPTAATDANGNTTDYTYAPEHGGVLTETGPLAPTRQNDGSMANVRPQKRYEYAQRTAWTSNGAGGYVAGPPMWLLMRERRCRTSAASGATCAGGAADEIVTDYDYGPNSGPNNLLLRGIAVSAHDGTGVVTRRTCYGYDVNGNRISETQPNANLATCS